MISQKLLLVPQGYIKDGQASFVADENTGAITASEDIEAQIMFIPKELKSESNAKVDPKMFLSSSIVKGLKFVVGPVTAVVTTVTQGGASVSILVADDEQSVHGDGTITLDLTGKFWKISHVLLNASVGNIPFIGSLTQVIEANPA